MAINDPNRLPAELAGAHLVRSHAWLGLLDLRSATEDLAYALRVRGASAVAESHRQSTAELQKRLMAAAKTHRRPGSSRQHQDSRAATPLSHPSPASREGRTKRAQLNRLLRDGCDLYSVRWEPPTAGVYESYPDLMLDPPPRGTESSKPELSLPVITEDEVRVELEALAKEQAALRPRSVARMQLALARALCSSGEWQTAEHTLCAALEFEPLDWRLYFLRAACRTHMLRLDLALDDVSAAIVLRPKEAELYLMRARLYGALGARRREEEQMERLAELAPTHRAVDEARASRRQAAMEGFRTALAATGAATGMEEADGARKTADSAAHDGVVETAATRVGVDRQGVDGGNGTVAATRSSGPRETRQTITSGLLQSRQGSLTFLKGSAGRGKSTAARGSGRSSAVARLGAHLAPLHTSTSVASVLRSVAQRAAGSVQSRVVSLCIAAALSRVCDGNLVAALQEVCKAAAVFAGERLQLPAQTLAALAPKSGYKRSDDEKALRDALLKKASSAAIRSAFARIENTGDSDSLGQGAGHARETVDSEWADVLLDTLNLGAKVAQESLDAVGDNWKRCESRDVATPLRSIQSQARQRAEAAEGHDALDKRGAGGLAAVPSSMAVSVFRASKQALPNIAASPTAADTPASGSPPAPPKPIRRLSALEALYDSTARRQSIGDAQEDARRRWKATRTLRSLLGQPATVLLSGLPGLSAQLAVRREDEHDMPSQAHEWVAFHCSPVCVNDRIQTARQVKAEGRKYYMGLPDLPVVCAWRGESTSASKKSIPGICLGVRVPSDVIAQYDRCMLALASQALEHGNASQGFRCAWVALRNEMAIRESVDPEASIRSFPCLTGTRFGDAWMGSVLGALHGACVVEGKQLPLLPLEGHVQRATACIYVVEGVQAALAARAAMALDDVHVLHGCPSRLNGARIDSYFVVALADAALRLGRIEAVGVVLAQAILDGTLPTQDFVPAPSDSDDEDANADIYETTFSAMHIPCPVLQVQLIFARWLEQLGANAARRGRGAVEAARAVLTQMRVSPQEATRRAGEISAAVARGELPAEAGYDRTPRDASTPQLQLAALTLQTSAYNGYATMVSREGAPESLEMGIQAAKQALLAATALDEAAAELLEAGMVGEPAATQARKSAMSSRKLASSTISECEQRLAGGTTHIVSADHAASAAAAETMAVSLPTNPLDGDAQGSHKPEGALARIARLTDAAKLYEDRRMLPIFSPMRLQSRSRQAVEPAPCAVDASDWAGLPSERRKDHTPVLHAAGQSELDPEAGFGIRGGASRVGAAGSALRDGSVAVVTAQVGSMQSYSSEIGYGEDRHVIGTGSSVRREAVHQADQVDEPAELPMPDQFSAGPGATSHGVARVRVLSAASNRSRQNSQAMEWYTSSVGSNSPQSTDAGVEQMSSFTDVHTAAPGED